NFQIQTASGRKAFDGAANVVDEPFLEQLQRGEVYGDARRIESGFSPVFELTRRFAQCPSAHCNDHARSLEQRNEIAGRHKASFGIVPTDQRLEPDNPPRSELDLRLVIEDELLGLDRSLEPCFKIE